MVVQQDAEIGVDLEGASVQEESVGERHCRPDESDHQHGDHETVQPYRSFGQGQVDRGSNDRR